MKLLMIFIVANLVNVIIQTIKSIATIKCGKMAAAWVNGLAYGFYTYIVILMSADLPLLAKCFIIGVCNLIGVYVVKLFEEKMQKDKLWKIELTVENEHREKLHNDLESFNIPHNYIADVGKWTLFNCYCTTRKESAFVKEMCDRNHAKYFVSETKIL